jgi:aminoglycoside phosphotransferase (APT) family kinase protein
VTLVAEPVLAEFLHAAGLAEMDDLGDWQPLSGGVSSDIWRVTTGKGTFCVKRALAQLKVAAEWKAPVSRNAIEWAYMELADEIAPGAVPQPIAHDAERGLFAMGWLAPEDHPLWKSELLAGRVDPDFAAAVGALIARIHAATARDPSVPRRFATDDSFDALRIEPYLRTTARAHPDLADAIGVVARITANTHKALVHGDVSPKNILIGPAGPVLLDAECGWFGDPAFDLAFCLNHLAIKARIVEGAREALLESFDRLAKSYLAGVDWEAAGAVEARAARLLSILALARVDGKSPVEYLDEAQRGELRRAARAAVAASPDTLTMVRDILTD